MCPLHLHLRHLPLPWLSFTQRWRERGTDGTADASVIAFRISSFDLSSKCLVFSLRTCPALRLSPCHPLSRDPSICYLATVSKATKLPSVCRPHLHISRPASLCSFVSAADCMDGEGTQGKRHNYWCAYCCVIPWNHLPVELLKVLNELDLNNTLLLQWSFCYINLHRNPLLMSFFCD